MGRALESLPTPLAYREFSAGLQEAINTAAYQALAENLQTVAIERVSPTDASLGKGYIHPLEPLVIGGDDLMLIVPGDAALPIATRMCQLFEKEMSNRISPEVWTALPEGLRRPTLSAGIAIAESHNPVRVLQQISRELCKSAKRRAYDEQGAGHPTSALDFLLIKSQSMLRRDVSQLRKTRPYYFDEVGQKAGRYMTAAPYTLKESCRLLGLLKLMRQVDFPVSQLQNLVNALQRGRQYGSIHYLYQQSRLKARLGEARKAENVLFRLQEIWHYDDEREPIPWHRVSTKEGRMFATIIPDLLELYPFVTKPAPDDLWQEILQEAGHND
jgi:CRISPR-associated protein Cmr2